MKKQLFGHKTCRKAVYKSSVLSVGRQRLKEHRAVNEEHYERRDEEKSAYHP